MTKLFKASPLVATFLSLLIIGCMQPQGYGGSPFGNLGSSEMLIIGIILLLVLGSVFMKGRGGSVRISGPTLVLRRFKIDESPSAQTPVEIIGRVSGLTAWLLTTMGFDAETTLKVSTTDVSFKSSSLSGETHQVVPLASVSSTHCGYSKPIGLLIIGSLILIGGLIASQFVAGLLLGGIFLLAYWLTKKITISVETSGGLLMGLAFKRSVIENVSVDIEQALKAIRIVNDNVVKSQTSHV